MLFGTAKQGSHVCRDLVAELPFTLTHPKPKESPPVSRPVSARVTDNSLDIIDANLIQLDTK